MNDRQNRVTLKDIAARTGYTVNTVSKALRGSDGLSLPTRRLIRETADEMGYIGNAMAGALRSGFTHTIALIVPDIANPFFSIIARRVDTVAQENGYAIMILNTREDAGQEERCVRLAMSKQVDGVLIFPVQHGTQAIELLQKAAMPVVLVGRDFEDFPADSVCVDDRRGGYLATEHLFAQGRRRILMVNAPPHISSAKKRLAGYKEALSDNRISEGIAPLTVRSILGGAHTLLLEAIHGGLSFDGLFAFSDMIAYECVCALREAGLSAPGDVLVVGFDDIQAKLMLPYPLTTIHTDMDEMALAAFSLLLRRIRGDGAGYPSRTVLPVRLVLRE